MQAAKINDVGKINGKSPKINKKIEKTRENLHKKVYAKLCSIGNVFNHAIWYD